MGPCLPQPATAAGQTTQPVQHWAAPACGLCGPGACRLRACACRRQIYRCVAIGMLQWRTNTLHTTQGRQAAGGAPQPALGFPALCLVGAAFSTYRQHQICSQLRTRCTCPHSSCPLQFIAEPDGSLVQLGEGAHGVVYLAKMQDDMYVAVKVRPAAHLCTQHITCYGRFACFSCLRVLDV